MVVINEILLWDNKIIMITVMTIIIIIINYNNNDNDNRKSQGGKVPGGDSYMKQTGMLVISLRGVNFGFWSRLGCSGQRANILSRQGLV